MSRALRPALPAVLLVLGAGSLFAQSVYTPGQLKPHQQVAHDIYKELIEIKSGVTTGNVTTAAMAMAKRFKDAGIPEADIFVGGARPEKFNVVARIRGRNSGRKPLILLAHLDVVEAIKSDWSDDLDPFVFTERDGYYYGRGTADDKAMASIFVANAFRLKQEGYVPDRDIIIALTTDEESGAFNGVAWLLENHPELVDGDLVINEGGGGTLRNGKPLFNSVQATEKITTNLTLRVTNRGGKGVINLKVTAKNGPVVNVRRVADEDEIMLVTAKGQMIRLPVKDVRIIGRATQGVRLIDLHKGDKVAALGRVDENGNGNGAGEK